MTILLPRRLIVLSAALTLTLSGCGRIERARIAAADSASAATMQDMSSLLTETVRRADRYARSANRILNPLPVMTAREEADLRRFRNADHVRSARAIGVRAVDRAAVDSLEAAGHLVPLPDSTRHWIVRGRRRRALLVPEMVRALEHVGERFEARLTEIGLPLYRFEITSALRTAEQQAELRQTNSNAASGTSSHEFGTTVDISYAAFAPPAELPDHVLADVPPAFVPQLERLADLALESVSARKSRELGAIFSEVLSEAQREGLILVLYERQQTIYHVTVAASR